MSRTSRVSNVSNEFKPSAELDSTPIPDQVTVVGAAAVPMITTALADKGITQYILWTLEGGAARFTLDGSDPVALTNGHLVADGSSAEWNRETAEKARWIREAAVTTNLRISELTGI